MGMFQTPGSNERFGVLETSRQRSVAASGSSQTDAALIGANVSLVSGASGTNGVVLRKGKAQYTGMIYSSAATNALLVYPPAGGTINNGSVNSPFSVTARKPAIFTSTTLIDFIINQSA